MDFTLDDEQQAIHDITKQVLGDLSTHSRLKDLAVADDHVDCDAWAALAEAGVVGASIPEAHGGAGLGFLATAMALEVAGYPRRRSRSSPRSSWGRCRSPSSAPSPAGRLAAPHRRWIAALRCGALRAGHHARRAAHYRPHRRRRIRSRRREADGRSGPRSRSPRHAGPPRQRIGRRVPRTD